MKSNKTEKSDLLEFLRIQRANRLIFNCKRRVALIAISDLIGLVFSGKSTRWNYDEYMEVVNELFSEVDENNKWLEIELEALEYLAKNYIDFGLRDKEQLIEKVKIVKVIINGTLSKLK